MTDNQQCDIENSPQSADHPLIAIKTGNHTIDKSITRVSRLVSWFQAIPAVAHFCGQESDLTTASAASLALPSPIFHFCHLSPS